MSRKLGVRRVMTPNQVVSHNVTKARALRGWTQDQAAEALAPYLGVKLSAASFSALERSAWKVERIKQFSADELLALSRGFDLPIGYFFTPPPPSADAGLHAPDAGWKGLDPIVLLDAILGTPENREYWEQDLLAYSASTAPAPKSKREKPSVSPSDLADRIAPLGNTRSKALLRQVFGDLPDASDTLERLAEAIRLLDEPASDDSSDQTTRGGTARKAVRGRKTAARKE
jgi:transcriptional regulator with XRE-family HTH domain